MTDAIENWLKQTRLFPHTDLEIVLVMNPHAGTFRNPRSRHQFLVLLDEEQKLLEKTDTSDRALTVTTIPSSPSGELNSEFNSWLLSEPAPWVRRLVVVAGGDGTSHSVLTIALPLLPHMTNRPVFFRLPLGTGNDNPDVKDLKVAVQVVSGIRPFQIEERTLEALQISIKDRPAFYSFNIASVGLDAFVVHLTKKLRRWLPGNLYATMVDIATLFYERFVKVVPSILVLQNQGQQVFRWSDSFLLVAMGVTGKRTYGGGKQILPDTDNVCLIGHRNFLSKLAYRKPIYAGTHRDLPGILLTMGDTLTIESPVRIPLQMDGELLWLDPSDFPITFQKVTTCIKVLGLSHS